MPRTWYSDVLAQDPLERVINAYHEHHYTQFLRGMLKLGDHKIGDSLPLWVHELESHPRRQIRELATITLQTLGYKFE